MTVGSKVFKLNVWLEEHPEAECRGPRHLEILGITHDSRQVRPGWLFAALPGTRSHGLDYVSDALQRGAVAVLCEQFPARLDKPATLIRVPSVRPVLADLAEAFYGHPASRLRLAGITGTNGKTTITFLARAILEEPKAPWGLIGTIEYRIGERVIPASRTTPEAPYIQQYLSQMVQAGCAGAVMEVSSHALDQSRVRGRLFDVGVFTNLTQDHLDYHQTMENYFLAKRKLFTDLGRGEKSAVAVINGDDPYGRRLLTDPEIAVPILSYGLSQECQIRACDVKADLQGSRFRVVTPWGEGEAAVRLPGMYNVSNALASIGLAGALGVPLEIILKRIETVRQVPGRLEPVPNRRGVQVFVDYAHTEDALTNVLQTLRPMTQGRLIVVFGCGGDRDPGKRPRMGAAAARYADYTILTSDNPRRENPDMIIAQIRSGMPPEAPCAIEPDRAEAIRTALATARPGDVVLIAGKGHETFQEFENRMVPFDDREAARRCLE